MISATEAKKAREANEVNNSNHNFQNNEGTRVVGGRAGIRTLKTSLASLAFLAFLASFVVAADLKPIANAKMVLQGQGIPAVQVFRIFGETFGVTVVNKENFNDPLSISVQDATVDQALSIMQGLLVEKGYYARLNREQRLLLVERLHDLDERDVRWLKDPKPTELTPSPEVVFVTFTLREGDARYVAAYIKSAVRLPGWVRVAPDAVENAIQVLATVSQLRDIMEALKASEQRLDAAFGQVVRNISIRHLKVRDAWVMLLGILNPRIEAEDLKRMDQLSGMANKAGAPRKSAFGAPPVGGEGGGMLGGMLGGGAPKASEPVAAPGAGGKSGLDEVKGASLVGISGKVDKDPFTLYMDVRRNSLTVVAPKALVERIESFLRQIDVEPMKRGGTESLAHLRVFKLTYARAEQVLAIVANLISSLYEQGEVTPQGQKGQEKPGTTPSAPGSSSPKPGGSGGDAGTGAKRMLFQVLPVPEEIQGGYSATTVAGRVSIVADLGTNSLLVMGEGDDLDLIAEGVAHVDQFAGQVLIEVAVAEAGLTDDQQLGIASRLQDVLSGKVTGGGEFGVDAAHLGGPAATDLSGDSLKIFLTGEKLSTVLNLLQKETGLKVLSNPRVMAPNNRRALISFQDSTPYKEDQFTPLTDRDGNRSNVKTGEVWKTIDTGIVLGITPRINDQGLITVDMALEVSEVTGAPPAASALPPTAWRAMLATAVVKQGQTIIMGGLVRERDDKRETRTPILSSLPIIGPLFSATVTSKLRRELVLFLTPTLLTTTGDVPKMMERMREKHPRLDWPTE